MLKTRRSSIITYSTVLVTLAGLLLLWPGMLRNLFTTNGFEPHGYCFIWTPQLLSLFSITDTLIGLSYVAISMTLAYVVYRGRQDIPFHWVFIAFGGFIISCGLTHFLDVVTLWTPLYWLSGYARLVTAVTSVITAMMLPPMLPKIFSMARSGKELSVNREQLAKANIELEALYKKQLELDTLKATFFSTISHELRTPLTLMLGPLEYLLGANNLTAQQQSILQTAYRNGRLLQQHIDELMDVAQLQTGQSSLNYVQVDLVPLIRINASYFQEIGEKQNITLTVNTPDTLIADVDVTKFNHISLNLLANSFRFISSGGKIAFSLSHDGDDAVITVRDNGPDIHVGGRVALFERIIQEDVHQTPRFTSASNLGLTIAIEFIAQQGGTISATSVQGGGAEFVVRVPIKAPQGVKVAEYSAPREKSTGLPAVLESLQPRTNGDPSVSGLPDINRPLILVVEDSVDMNEFICTTLSESYRTISAFDGYEGLKRALEMQPDLIISDLSMPRMNGETMLHAIRANEGIKDTPIVMLTAMLEDERRITLLREGAQDYLVKPFSVEELRVRVDNLIAEKRAREMLRQELRMQNKDVADLSMEIERRKRQLNQALIDLRRSESRFRRLFDSNIIGIISATIGGVITEANEKFLSILSYTREDLVMTSINWQRITPDEHRENDKRAIEQLLKNGVAEPWEKEYIRKDGTRVPVLLGLAMLEDSQVETVGFVVDLTEQRRAEDAQRFLADASSMLVSSLDYQTIMQNLMAFCVPRFADWAALYMVDEADLRLVEIAAADEQLQLDLADLKEQGIEASEFNDVRTAINNNKPILIERVYQPANWRANINPENRENRETQVSIISLQKAKSRIVIPLQAHGRVIGAMLFNTAESNRYYTQSDLALAQELANRAALAVDNTRLYAESQQAVRARDEFMSVAAHELKTPITSLRGFSQLALKQFKRPEPDYARIQQSLDAIEFQSGKLAKLVAQLLGFARIQSGRLILEREMMDFAALTRNIIEEARLRTNEHTITLTAPDVFRIYADAIRLEQVVANLLDNAIKYSPEGGPVDAVLDVLPDPDKPERKIARLSIRDKGLGIPEEHRSHIFDRFYQAHRRRYLGGMGLGLYISREIVVMHGGQLVAEFPDDGGTRFVVTLPVITEELANG